jgi:O-antigen/teichoic acid export membrane protein
MHQPDTAEEKTIFEPGPTHQNQHGSAPTSYTDRFARGAFWSLVGAMGARLSIFIGAVIIARILGQVGFGELGMIQSTIGMLGVFAGLGIGGTAIKYVAELRLKDPARAGRIIGLTYLVSWTAGGLMALGCFLAAPWLAVKTINAPHLVPEIRLASFLLFVSAGFGPQAGILSGFQAFRALAKINWWGALLSFPITVALVWLAGLRGVILALIINTLLGAILSAWFLRHEYKVSQVRINFQEAWRERTILWGFSLPFFLSSVILVPTSWAANLILVHQPDGYAQLGLVNAAMQFNWMITAVNNIVAMVSVSLLSEIHGNSDPERFARVFNLNLRLNWSLAIVMAFAALLLSPWLIQVFGAKFLAAAALLPIVICYTAIGLVSAIGGQFFISSGRMWANFTVNLIAGLLFLIIVYWLVPFYLAKGMVISNLIGIAIGLMLHLTVIYKIFGKAILANILNCVLSTFLLVLGGVILFFGQPFIVSILSVMALAAIAIALIIKYNFMDFQRYLRHFSQLFILKIRILYTTKKS